MAPADRTEPTASSYLPSTTTSARVGPTASARPAVRDDGTGSAPGSSSSSAPRQWTPDEDEEAGDDAGVPFTEREVLLGGEGEAYELRDDIDWERSKKRRQRGGRRRRQKTGVGGGDSAGDGGADGDGDGDDDDGSGVEYEGSGREDGEGEAEGEEQDDEEEGASGPRFGHRSAVRRRTSIASTVASFQLYTPDEERRVVRKFDRRLVLFVALLYMLSFLDRSSMRQQPP